MISADIIILVSAIAIICGSTVVMAIVARKNERERRTWAIKYIKDSQQYSRIWKWRNVAIKWNIERNEPVKVKFD